jgi:hypothetical protein
MFHLKDGWNFGRQDDGSVVIEHRNYQIDAETGKYTQLYTVNTRLVVDADGWASVIASVSAGGEDHARFFAALEFHNSNGEIAILQTASEKRS